MPLNKETKPYQTLFHMLYASYTYISEIYQKFLDVPRIIWVHNEFSVRIQYRCKF